MIVFCVTAISYFFGKYTVYQSLDTFQASNIIATPTLFTLCGYKSNTSLQVIRSDFTLAVHPQFIDLLKQKKEIASGGSNILIVSEDSGHITDISTQGKQINTQLFPFGIKLKTPIQDDWIWYTQKILDKTVVFIDIDKNLQLVSLGDLRIGDEIVIREYMDASIPPTDEGHSLENVVKILNRKNLN